MSKTKADLRAGVLRLLVVIDPTESPDAEQQQTLDVIIDACRDQLEELGLVWWEEDAIPGAVFLPLRRYVAAFACTDFGRAAKGYEAGEEMGLKALRKLKNSEQRETVRTEYF